eukprot:m.124799 g.124799  ORF g.124799 m.124799 type:complete len:104 (+) comp13513_c0_seq2:1481-1792(+)
MLLVFASALDILARLVTSKLKMVYLMKSLRSYGLLVTKFRKRHQCASLRARCLVEVKSSPTESALNPLQVKFSRRVLILAAMVVLWGGDPIHNEARMKVTSIY